MEEVKISHESTDSEGVDTDRFSRIIAFLGAGTVKALMSLKVLVCGLDGLGAEISKNLILSGVGAVTLHDTKTASWSDLSSHFYLAEADVGKNRAESCVSQLRELNPYTKVSVHTEELSTAFLGGFQVVVMVNWPSQAQLLEFGDFCHKHEPAIVFIKADARGLFSSIFSDFGPTHVVLDKNGEEPKQAIVVSISNSNPAIVTTHDEKPHGLSEGDYVYFEEVEGMKEINTNGVEGSHTSAIKVLGVRGLYAFEIDLDTTKFGSYTGRGVVNEVKVQLLVRSRSYREALDYPGEFIISDFAKFGRAEQYHYGFQALLEYQARHNGELPEAWNKDHAKEVVDIAKELNEATKKRNEPIKERNAPHEKAHSEAVAAFEAAKKVYDEAKKAGENIPAEPKRPAAPQLEPLIFSLDEIDEGLLTKLALVARGNLNPFAAFVGGVVAQEVLKKTGKYHPVHQWFYFDSTEALPESVTDSQATNSRYDGQIAVFGKAFQQKLFDLNLFLVGAGALGCEFLKNFALMGVSCGKEGKGSFFLTDMDNIEKSNLSRQFLFRDSDLLKMKSVCASRAAKVINPELRITASEVPVGEDTEDTFNDEFWQGQDVIVNALDNVKARLYVDSQCVKFLKPLLESGTLGTKANSQVILPHLTESYGSSRDPPDTAIPLCTLKNFPHQIEHTIEWARDRFQGLFNNSFADANNLLSNGPEFLKGIAQLESPAVQKERLVAVDDLLALYKEGNVTFAECVNWARHQFQEMFHNTVAQLLFNFPEDSVTSTGVPFWSGPKRPPVPAEFDVNNPTHLEFIVSASNLLAFSFRLPQEKDPKKIADLVKGIQVPPFAPKKGVRIKGGEDDNTVEGSDEDEVLVKRLLDKLAQVDASHFKFSEGRVFDPSQFEKDDDKNFHVAFMTSASNCRAANYKIKPADFQKTKKIAGRIIPAIATTTAMITGLVAVELYKVVLGGLPLESFRNSYINLALPSFVQSEPMPCPKHKSDPAKELRFYPEGWSLWDNFIVDEGDITFQQLLDIFQNKHKLNVASVSCGSSLAYNPFFPGHKDRLSRKISEWVQASVTSYKIKPTDKYINLIILCEDEEDHEVEIPDPVRIKFRN